LQVSITESKVIKEGWLGVNSYVIYRLETKVIILCFISVVQAS